MNELGWLIETHDRTARSWWWGGGGYRHWVTDANLAVRFCRKADADRVISMLGLDAEAAEHMWCS
jgi:hypothetical protein